MDTIEADWPDTDDVVEDEDDIVAIGRLDAEDDNSLLSPRPFPAWNMR